MIGGNRISPVATAAFCGLLNPTKESSKPPLSILVSMELKKLSGKLKPTEFDAEAVSTATTEISRCKK
jgi:hypothetical protein